MVEQESIERLKTILGMAFELGWIKKSQNKSEYPIMQLSEVEKVMLAMIDETEYQRMAEWVKQKNG